MLVWFIGSVVRGTADCEMEEEVMLEKVIAISVEELFEKVIEQERRLSEVEKRLGIKRDDISSSV